LDVKIISVSHKLPSGHSTNGIMREMSLKIIVCIVTFLFLALVAGAVFTTFLLNPSLAGSSFYAFEEKFFAQW
jgi:hypothetical protein